MPKSIAKKANSFVFQALEESKKTKKVDMIISFILYPILIFVVVFGSFVRSPVRSFVR